MNNNNKCINNCCCSGRWRVGGGPVVRSMVIFFSCRSKNRSIFRNDFERYLYRRRCCCRRDAGGHAQPSGRGPLIKRLKSAREAEKREENVTSSSFYRREKNEIAWRKITVIANRQRRQSNIVWVLYNEHAWVCIKSLLYYYILYCRVCTNVCGKNRRKTVGIFFWTRNNWNIEKKRFFSHLLKLPTLSTDFSWKNVFVMVIHFILYHFAIISRSRKSPLMAESTLHHSREHCDTN